MQKPRSPKKGGNKQGKPEGSGGRGRSSSSRSGKDESRGSKGSRKPAGKFSSSGSKPYKKGPSPHKKPAPAPQYNDSEFLRLNKYIANAGVCSRREADTLIETGVVSVNDKIVLELGTRVRRTDTVKVGGESLHLEKRRYLLLNKPKDFITATDDPFHRRTVMTLIKDACKEAIFPVDKMDRNTTGLLLFTNDADLAKVLTHPRNETKKIFHVHLDKPVGREVLKKLESGIPLDDGSIGKVDTASFVTDNPREIGVELSSGKPRIVARLFEALEQKIKKVDRVYFAGLTKKDLPRGYWRFLTDEEVNIIRRSVRKDKGGDKDKAKSKGKAK